MKHIKTWSERCEEHPDHQHGMISKSMIQARMQEEIDELRQALKTEQEPVCWTVADGWVYANDTSQVGTSKEVNWEPLYTAPPKQWVGLTDEEVNELVARFKRYSYVLLREVEAKLKEKNHG